jgi:hypothetical protein
MNNQIQVSGVTDTKTRDLFLGILFDLIGMASYALPFLGEFTDVVWAPISGVLMIWMYKGNLGKIGGVLSTIEELLPGIDFIPTFTLTWIYKYVITKS